MILTFLLPLEIFGGRRWNLMVPRILRPSVSEPVLDISTQLMGRKWAPLPAIFSTFVVSAIMLEISCFIWAEIGPLGKWLTSSLLHGVSLSLEVAVKKAILVKNNTGHRRGLPWIISAPLTVLFVLAVSPRILFSFARDVFKAFHFNPWKFYPLHELPYC